MDESTAKPSNSDQQTAESSLSNGSETLPLNNKLGMGYTVESRESRTGFQNRSQFSKSCLIRGVFRNLVFHHLGKSGKFSSHLDSAWSN